MHRRDFLKILSLTSLAGCSLAGCGLLRIDPDHFLIRSDVLGSLEDEARVLKKAQLKWTDDGRVRVLFVNGTPYERGYQHGALLRNEVKDNLEYLYKRAVSKFHIEELFYEAFERQRPYIPDEYIEEMHGLAHGAKVPINLIHAIHALPELGEWGGKKRIKGVVKEMMDGTLGTSCSNFCLEKGAAAGDNFYSIRILDWGLHRISKLHEYPLITVGIPENGNCYANIGWVGFLGAISGMNEKGITLGEMGYGDIPNESLRGKPMPFLLRDILTHTSNLKEVRQMISESRGTNSFVYLMSDGKSRESELYIRDRERFVVFKAGETITDKKSTFPGLENTLYAGHYQEVMTKLLSDNQGKISVEMLQSEIIPKMAMPSNFQNVIYDPVHLQFWVANAKSTRERAAEQPYTFFDFGAALAAARGTYSISRKS